MPALAVALKTLSAAFKGVRWLDRNGLAPSNAASPAGPFAKGAGAQVIPLDAYRGAAAVGATTSHACPQDDPALRAFGERDFLAMGRELALRGASGKELDFLRRTVRADFESAVERAIAPRRAHLARLDDALSGLPAEAHVERQRIEKARAFTQQELDEFGLMKCLASNGDGFFGTAHASLELGIATGVREHLDALLAFKRYGV